MTVYHSRTRKGDGEALDRLSRFHSVAREYSLDRKALMRIVGRSDSTVRGYMDGWLWPSAEVLARLEAWVDEQEADAEEHMYGEPMTDGEASDVMSRPVDHERGTAITTGAIVQDRTRECSMGGSPI